MAKVAIRRARPSDGNRLADLCYALWPESPRDEHAAEVREHFEGRSRSTLPMAHFVAETDEGEVVGFLEAGLRSHADCCDTSRPAGYVEGWYVEEGYRRQGIGGKLVAAAEEWARGLGCREMASDALIENDLSQRAHAALGFEVVARSVLYRKAL